MKKYSEEVKIPSDPLKIAAWLDSMTGRGSVDLSQDPQCRSTPRYHGRGLICPKDGP